MKPGWVTAVVASYNHAEFLAQRMVRQVGLEWRPRRVEAMVRSWWARRRALEANPEANADEIRAVPEVAASEAHLAEVLLAQGDDGRQRIRIAKTTTAQKAPTVVGQQAALYEVKRG